METIIDSQKIPYFDVAIIGGGINGCGCAADAALRGLSVFLCDKGHLASGTSSNSTKLIHGGLRYLEHYDFSLVKKALDERQQLLRLAPHLVHPLPLILPLLHTERSPWLLRAGLFIYDHLSFVNQLPRSQRFLRKTQPHFFQPLHQGINEAFLFYDANTDDARLTISNALQAKAYGAVIQPQTEMVLADAQDKGWLITLRSSGRTFQIAAKTMINAGGPRVDSIAKRAKISLEHQLTLVKGSHILVPALYPDDHAYLLQHHDQRIIFVIPFHGYSMIGTTDVLLQNHPEAVHIDESEIDYLLTLANQYFARHLTPQDVVYTWSGIRPLLASDNKNPSALSRDYFIEQTQQPAPCITIYGGKITTYRKLAEQVINALQSFFPHSSASKTSHTPLPGATWQNMDWETYQKYAIEEYSWLEPATLKRYLQTYGTRCEILLKDCSKMADLGPAFAPTFYLHEAEYLYHEEWATSIDSMLWLNTKLGLSMDQAGIQALKKWFESEPIFSE